MSSMVLDRFHTLSSGDRVRLRLARPSDRALAAGDDMARRRLARDWAVVATVFDGSHERIVGSGALDATLVASDPEVRGLLERGLEEHARTWSLRVA